MTKSSRDAGYTMPAEWAPHERCWMAWPCDSHWDSGPGLDTIRGVFTDVAQAIRCFEPLTMLTNPADVEGARTQLGPDIDVLPMVYNSGCVTAGRALLSTARAVSAPPAGTSTHGAARASAGTTTPQLRRAWPIT